MITVIFKEDTELAPDGLNTRLYEKGEKYTSHTNIERMLFEHMIAQGKAEEALVGKAPGQKVSLPKERKKRTRKMGKNQTGANSFEIEIED